MPTTASIIQNVRRSVSVSGESLSAKVFRGGAWLGIGSVTEQACRFSRNIVLARLLAPEAFGTMAIVLSASSAIHTITDIGVKEAIIQNPKGEEEHYKSAAWWLAIGRALFLYSVLFCLAPFIAQFYGRADLTALLRVATLTVIFDGALSSQAYIAIKQMKFSKWAAINHGGGIVGVTITVLLAFVISGVWALAIGYCTESLFRCILSYALCPYIPSLSWDKKAFSELLHFSKRLFGLSFLNLIFARTDIFVLAKLFPSAGLGLYVMAIGLVQTPTSFLMNSLGQTLLPTYSQIQNENQRLNRILCKVSAVIALMAIPGLLFIFISGHSLLTIAYGQKYGLAATSLAIAAVVAVVNLLNGQITTVFYSKGSPHLHRSAVALMALSMIVLVYPCAKSMGIAGGQVAALISVVVGYIFQLVRIHRVTELNVPNYGRGLLIATAASISVGVLYFVLRSANSPSAPVNLAYGGLGCLLAYGLIGAIYWRRTELV